MKKLEWIVGTAPMPDIPPDVGLVVVAFSREEVEGFRVGRAVDDLMRLSDDARLRRQLQHGLVVTFSGYFADPREVFQIPQCRQFLKAVHAQWPYWLHFLAPLPDAWSVFLLCMLDSEAQSRKGSAVAASLPVRAVQDFQMELIGACTPLHNAMALPIDERFAIFERASRAIGECIQ